MTTESWTLDSLRELARGFRLPMVVLALVRAGIIDRLVEGPRSSRALADACGVDELALARVLGALVSIGLLRLDAGVYALPVRLAEELSASSGVALDGLAHAADGLDKWIELERVLRNGSAEYPDERDVTVSPERNERFIRAMHSYAGPAALRFAELVPRNGARTFLDLGGGPGTFTHALLAAWPDLEATIADLPLSLRVTRAIAAERGVADRLEIVEADFYHDRGCELGGPYDLVLVSAVLHAEGEAENRELLGRVRKVVATGGRIVVRENLLAPDRTGPARATLFDVHMLVSTRRGRCYTLSEVSSMLEDADFRDARLLSDLDEGLVVADA
jgi:hypothetical protein